MNPKAVIKVICLTAIGAPGIFAATQGLVIPPAGAAMMALLALAAGYTLSELDPGWKSGSGLSEDQTQAIVDALEDRLRGTAARPRPPRG